MQNSKDRKRTESQLEETNKYKYLGEIINNKGNLKDHLEELRGKNMQQYKSTDPNGRQRIQGNKNESFMGTS